MKDTREHILSSSLKLFLQKNFKEVTMKEIVSLTGLSKGAFYHYFTSKEHVFLEVLNHFFGETMTDDFSKLSATSLKDFYTGLISNLEINKRKVLKMIGEEKDDAIQANFYYLIFDAMKILPNYKQQHIAQQKVELKAWTEIIGTAKNKGEIKSKLSDQQIAKMFIYIGDGLGINAIMTGDSKINKDLKLTWDGLYQSLQV